MAEDKLKEKTAKGFAWGALSNGTVQILNAAFGIILSRQLSQDDYGLINMIVIFTYMATSLQESGFVTALTNKRDATHRDYNSVFWFNISISVVIYLLLFFSAPLIARFFNEPILVPLSRYYFLGILVASFSIVPRAVMFRQIKQREIAIMNVTSLLISGIVGVTMVFHGMAFWSLATQSLTYITCTVILSWVLSGWRPSLDITMRPVREMFGFSSKMLITYIFNNINTNVFSFILGRLYGKFETGVYSQANKWNTMGASTITGMVQGVAQPTFVQVGSDVERLRRAFSKMLRFTCFITFPAMFGLALVAPEFIVITVGEKWLSSARLMQVICVGGAFLPIATLYYNMVISRGKSNIYMWNVIVQGIVILSAILGVHFMGGNIMHMVLAHTAIIILWVVVWQYFVWREIRFSPLQALRDVVPFLLLSVLTMCVTHFVTLPITNTYLLFLSRVLVAATIYLSLLWITGAHILRECLQFLLKR